LRLILLGRPASRTVVPVNEPRETILSDGAGSTGPRRPGRRRARGLFPTDWRQLDQVGIAALAAGVLVLIGLGFAVLSPLLAGPPKAEALPPTAGSDQPVPAGPAPGTAGPSSTASLLHSLPPATKLPGSKPGDLEDQLVAAINQARGQAGCQAVKDDGHLHNSARSHSDDMARKGYVSRTGSDGSSFSDRIRKAGYRDPLGEDVGRGYQTGQQAVDAWMGTPDMKSAIVNCAAKAVGAGVSFAKDGTVYWTADFGR
jgi:uncharacterized protein YkwD